VYLEAHLKSIGYDLKYIYLSRDVGGNQMRLAQAPPPVALSSQRNPSQHFWMVAPYPGSLQTAPLRRHFVDETTGR